MHVPGDILGIVIWMVEMIRSAHVDILWFYIYFFIWLCQVLVAAYRSLVFVMACRIFSYSMWDLTRASNPGPPVLEIQSLSHLTTRKVPILTFSRGKWPGLGKVSQLTLRQGQAIRATSQNLKIYPFKFLGRVTKYSGDL